MNGKKIFGVMAVAAFVVFGAIGSLQASDEVKKPCDQQKVAEQGCQSAQGCQMMQKIPNLTAEQKGQLEKLHAEHQKMMAEAKADMQKKVMALLTDEQKAKLGKMDCGTTAHAKCGKTEAKGCGESKAGHECKQVAKPVETKAGCAANCAHEKAKGQTPKAVEEKK